MELLLEGINADALLADRAYDTDEIVAIAQAAGMEIVIPPKKNREHQRENDEYLYRLRHLAKMLLSCLSAGVALLPDTQSTPLLS